MCEREGGKDGKLVNEAVRMLRSWVYKSVEYLPLSSMSQCTGFRWPHDANGRPNRSTSGEGDDQELVRSPIIYGVVIHVLLQENVLSILNSKLIST